MKILEAQSAVLTNYEVFEHLVAQKQRYIDQHKTKEREKPYGMTSTSH